MNRDKKTAGSKAVTHDETKISILEAHEDLNEFKATKKTVTDLLNYKRSLIDIEDSDFEKIAEIKSKAIDAINHLFDDIINTKKG